MAVIMNQITELLSAPFLLADHRTKPGAGNLTYVKTGAYIERLNNELGPCWSWTIISQELNIEKRAAVVHGRLSMIDANGVTWHKDGVGVGQDMTNGQKEELDKILKTANSEAIKNAAKLLGVGLYLYNPEELKKVEFQMRTGSQQPAQRQAAPVAAADDGAYGGDLWKSANRDVRAAFAELAPGTVDVVAAPILHAVMKNWFKAIFVEGVEVSSTKLNASHLTKLADGLRTNADLKKHVLNQIDIKKAA